MIDRDWRQLRTVFNGAARTAELAAAETYRYERKFIVTEAAARAIGDFARAYLPPDAHMGAAGEDGYRVCSLYVDARDLSLYRHSINGLKNRYKLRIRFYDESPAAPAFLEIKKRTTNTVHKLRAVVGKPAAERLLRGESIATTELLSQSDAAQRALAEFCECFRRLDAVGVAFVDYQREAYASQSAESCRVTFDRRIVSRRYCEGEGLTPPRESAPVATKGVVLELKYGGRAPQWMQDLVVSFNLQRTSYPKYVHCADALGACQVGGPGAHGLPLARYHESA